MKKFIFLDIDGVLNSIDLSVAQQATERAPKSRLHDIDPVRVGLLKWVVDMTNANIVISSTWRTGRTAEWFVGFFEALNWCNPPIVGVTPISNGIRGDEINEYLTLNGQEECKYVILDDDSDFHENQPFIHVDRIAGLSLKHTIACIDILGLDNEYDRDVLESLREHATFERTTTFGNVDLGNKKQ